MDLKTIAEVGIDGAELLNETAEKEPAAAGDELPAEVAEPAAAAPITSGDQAPAPAHMPEPIPEPAAAEAVEAVEPAAAAEPERLPARKARLNPFKTRSHPAFYLLYLLLFVLIGYMGFQAIQSIKQARSETGFVSVAKPAEARIVAKVESTASGRPLDGYRRIWERNLFNIAREGDSGSEKEIVIEEIAPARKDLGLKLVCTVTADDAGLRRAFIDDSKTRRQKGYREGDAAGKVRIKRSLRNRVIVGTSEGDRLLVADIEAGSGTSSSLTYAQQISSVSAGGGQYPQQIAGRRRPGRSFVLAREEVEASLADIAKLEQQLNIEPYVKDDQPAGFTIGNIQPDSILRQMGLKSCNAIIGANDRPSWAPNRPPSSSGHSRKGEKRPSRPGSAEASGAEPAISI